ncbi:MAG: phosphatidylinositol phosphodiesterase, partial [Bacteroidaceae bacterium]|nr:phosphatidylinositol phosphodiesterase [Bacteroidaceae bacterium]
MRILLTLLLFTALPTLSQNLNLCEWMKSVPDATPLCQLSIPGTHDSGALDGGEAFQTQELTIEEQLEGGIRCFDIRLKACDNNLLGV